MNVKQIRQRIERIVRHAPDVEAHREEILDRLNDAVEQLILREDWAFRKRYHTLRLKADVTISSYTGGGTVTTPGDANFTGTVPLSATFAIPTGWTDDDVQYLQGHVAEISDSGDTAEDGRWIIDLAWTYSGGTMVAIILDPRHPGTWTNSGGVAPTLVLKHVRYRLPIDAADVDNVVLRDTEDGLLYETPVSQEARLLLKDDDGASDPVTYIVHPSYNWPFEIRSGKSYPNVQHDPPLTKPTLTPTNSTGTFTVGEIYEYCYAWEFGGIVSSPSEIERVEIKANTDTVSISGLEVAGSASDATGRQKHIYRRQIVSEVGGPWFKVLTTFDHDTTLEDTNAFSYPGADPSAVTRRRQYTYGGMQKHIRFWPTPSTDQDGELHYFARSPRLDAQGDEPEMPPEMHVALVHAVARDLLAEADAHKLSAYHNARYNEVVDLARRTYLGNRGVRIQRKKILSRRRAGLTWVDAPTYTGG